MKYLSAASGQPSQQQHTILQKYVAFSLICLPGTTYMHDRSQIAFHFFTQCCLKDGIKSIYAWLCTGSQATSHTHTHLPEILLPQTTRAVVGCLC